MKKYILIIITILWMVMIFMFSNQKSVQSTNKSHSFVMNTIVRIYKIFDKNITDEKIEDIVNTWDVPIRKCAHFMEFFILGLLVFYTSKEFNIKDIYIMILFCFLYACSDEIHQVFVIGRDGNIIDTLIDSLGSTTAILLLNRKDKKYE